MNELQEPNQPGRLNWMQRYLAEEYVEDLQEGALSRREAIKYLAAVLGSMAAATTFLAGCAPAPIAPEGAAGAAATATGPVAATDLPATTADSATLTPALPTATLPASIVTPEQTRAVATAAVLATVDTSPTPTPAAVPAGVTVPADDPSLNSMDVKFPGDGLEVMGYLARPQGDGPFPAILVCHENRGLTDHIKDVTRRAAKAGYVGLAVDLLSQQGGTASVTDAAQIPAALSGTAPEKMAGYFLSGITYLKAQPFVAGDKIGMTGFCFGGGMTWLVATMAPELKAAVPFYGPNPPLEAVPNIRAAVLGIYGGDDTRINAGIPDIEAAMQQSGKVFEKMIYSGANHAFHNDTGARYKPDAAVDAWARTLAWFEKYVKGA